MILLLVICAKSNVTIDFNLKTTIMKKILLFTFLLFFCISSIPNNHVFVINDSNFSLMTDQNSINPCTEFFVSEKYFLEIEYRDEWVRVYDSSGQGNWEIQSVEYKRKCMWGIYVKICVKSRILNDPLGKEAIEALVECAKQEAKTLKLIPFPDIKNDKELEVKYREAIHQCTYLIKNPFVKDVVFYNNSQWQIKLSFAKIGNDKTNCTDWK